MTIAHLKIWLNQDADMLAVAEIVAAYDGAELDDDNYIVYFNGSPIKAAEMADEIHYFQYRAEAHNEII